MFFFLVFKEKVQVFYYFNFGYYEKINLGCLKLFDLSNIVITVIIGYVDNMLDFGGIYFYIY